MEAGVGRAKFRFRCQQQVKDDVCGWACDGSTDEALKVSSADATKPGVLPSPAADSDSKLHLYKQKRDVLQEQLRSKGQVCLLCRRLSGSIW